MRQKFDVCIVGGGPSGLAAATWLGRFRKSVVILDSGEYRNRWTERVHGYLGSDPISPNALLESARKDLKQYENISIVRDHVSDVKLSGDSFLTSGRSLEYASKRLILATGVVDSFPNVEGFDEHYGANVHHCPYCDGYESKNKHVAVLGFSDESASFATGLLNWAASVTLIAQREAGKDKESLREALGDPGVNIVWEPPVAFTGKRGNLTGVIVESGVSIACDIAFFSTPNHPRSKLAEQLGCRFTEEDCVEVDDKGATSVKGLYAAGDLTPGPHLVQVAAAKGTMAGTACARSIIE